MPPKGATSSRKLFEVDDPVRFRYHSQVAETAVLSQVGCIPGLPDHLHPPQLFPRRLWKMATALAPNKPDDRRPLIDRSQWPTCRLDASASRAIDWLSAELIPSHVHLDIQRTDSVIPLVKAFNESPPNTPVQKVGSDLVSCFSNIPHALVWRAWSFYRACAAGRVQGITAHVRLSGRALPHHFKPGWKPGMVSFRIRHHLSTRWFSFGGLIGIELNGLPMGSSLANSLARMWITSASGRPRLAPPRRP